MRDTDIGLAGVELHSFAVTLECGTADIGLAGAELHSFADGERRRKSEVGMPKES